MARPLFAFVLILSALVQATVLPEIGPIVVLPNLVLVLVLVRSATRGLAEALVWIALAGVVLDVLAMDSLGVNGLALLPVGLLGVVARRRFFQSGVLFPMLLAMAATVLNVLVLATLRAIGGDGALAVTALARMLFLQALLNALLVPPLYGLVVWMNRMEPERSS